ncbi:unnamed protein product [Fraxinus pennsylvanica]|uniref:Uncharacterized protein n=1 Tax=Fraxinus pennsylvanica TaxID=56036 RepID=A0AAD1Z057_9LAMI|nr:unnamed protein product [Fraxinus pennsylvanica]
MRGAQKSPFKESIKRRQHENGDNGGRGVEVGSLKLVKWVGKVMFNYSSPPYKYPFTSSSSHHQQKTHFCLYIQELSKLFLFDSVQMGKDIEVGAEYTTKDYQDPPPALLIDPEELTKWSFYRAIIAEFVATLLFLYITVLTVIGYKSQSAADECGGVGILGIAWAFGGMIFVLVYCTAGISGGHINPAVTLGLFLARKAFQKSYYVKFGGGANGLAEGYSNGTGLAAEIIGTFVLVYTVFSATDPKRNARDSHVPVLAPLPIGFAVFMVHLATIPITGTGINPARSLGAAVIYGKDEAWDDQWIFWVGPFIGAAIAAFYHQYILRAGAVKALGSFRSTPY